jgi:uncharacterized spore protein YtfJ
MYCLFLRNIRVLTDLLNITEGDAMSNINENLDALFQKMENFISTKTVVGEPINVGTTTLIPLVDVSFGVGAGSSEKKGDKSGEAGAGGLGAKIKPTAVLVIGEHGVQMVSVETKNGLGRLVDIVPGIVDKVEGFVKNKGNNDYDEYYDE